MAGWIKKVSFHVWLITFLMSSFIFAMDSEGPRLEFVEEGFDFGIVETDTVLQHVFSFKNSGSDTLFIKRVSSG